MSRELVVEWNGDGAAPIGLWLVGNSRRAAKLNGERKLLAGGTDAVELTSGEWLGHVWLPLHETRGSA